MGLPENSTSAPATDTNHHLQGICPTGWYLPDENIFWELYAIGGEALKSDSLWLNNLNVTNASGFNALPAGLYNVSTGEYYYLFGNAYFWTSTSEDNATAKKVELECHCAELLLNANIKGNGYSVRCVRNIWDPWDDR